MIYRHVAAALFLSVSVYARAETFPVEIAENNRCEEIRGFYDVPGGIDPPFLYGYIQNIKHSGSVIFWCKSKDDRKLYKLIGYVKNDDKARCSGLIHQTKNFPGGLTLSKVENETLVGYKNLSGNIKIAINNYHGVIIKSFYDGVGNTYVCSNGEWYFKQWD